MTTARDEEIIESLAALEHDQWRTWARHLLYHADGEPSISENLKEAGNELHGKRSDF
jgi:hypothetical protein